ncbi:MAG: UDP-N-acetylmuramoyl-L-alanyl-D-glutamate--2,6-diaminopimelate ligase [Butyrivibrio sp.]|nr:UDP-N-acetylmuramoyl-L-alanyl-D-glutamate--2,6-diaminopimelate ligase [Butyrivibrio sp.]
MKLDELLIKLNYELINGESSAEINRIIYDTREKMSRGDVFVCIRGAVFDGHDYIGEAAAAGAAAVIVERAVELTEELGALTVIRVESTRRALALMSAEFFGNPARELFTVGITGTKGKTTTTFMVHEVLEKCGIPTGLIGTNEIIIGNEHISAQRTTPESYKIHEYFRKMADAGCKCVVMEVSSQALKLDRTAGIFFDIGVFTNLEPDHIGPNEHDSFEDYLRCKALLFRQCQVGIVNADSEYTNEILKDSTCKTETYGLGGDARLRAENISYAHNGGALSTSYDVSGEERLHVELALPGLFSVYNSLCAIAVTRHFKTAKNLLLAALLEVKVEGRVEPVRVSDDFTVMIDYAHNAMSLESLLTTLREYKPNRIIAVFGCGGNRSRDRRFEMGEISGRLSDFTVITSDNPRFEEPEDIMNDIETGMRRTDGRYIKIADRAEAIRHAVSMGERGDIIVVVGKGHEDYQEIKGVKYHMKDRELIEAAIKR